MRWICAEGVVFRGPGYQPPSSHLARSDLALGHILPIGMALHLRTHEGAERHDFPATGASGMHRMFGKRLADTLAAQRIGNGGVIDDDEFG